MLTNVIRYNVSLIRNTKIDKNVNFSYVHDWMAISSRKNDSCLFSPKF